MRCSVYAKGGGNTNINLIPHKTGSHARGTFWLFNERVNKKTYLGTDKKYSK